MDASRSAQRTVIQFLRAEGKHASQIYHRMKGGLCHGLVVTNSATISAVDEIIRQNRRITTREIAVELSISKGTVQHIVHKNLGYGKVRTVGAQGYVRESEDGENGCLIGPGVSTLKPSIPSYALG
ncbi:hypothetical protein AVEN_58761-1 [Araneus ventricosus]|uniref:Uncharacterized protein n=1 Tax=Araneus ventricosus TaxID=182803 RepID=A0A4Y2RF79_ARAVE|nr:hypothetical protein AVEN_58761-1 [Araneus ventricosus]